jgi:hypothetical protein
MIHALVAFVVVMALWSLWGFFGSRVEQAGYTVAQKMKGYEIREYPAQLVAQTAVQGSFAEALNNGFRILAEYIFGGNARKKSMAMTAPVVAQKAGNPSERIAMTAPVKAASAVDDAQ